MQPTFCPWAGFFNLIGKSESFVFLDDAQFQKNSWHNRNQILVNGEKHWLTMPVVQEKLEKKICETEFKDFEFWKKKHIKIIRQNYSKHAHFQDVDYFLNFYESLKVDNLAELNIAVIRWFSNELKLSTSFYLSSEIGISGSRTERLIKILEYLDTDIYLSPVGAKEYLIEDDFNTNTDVTLTFQEYESPEYQQKNAMTFISHLSILDVISNMGFLNAHQYVLGCEQGE